MKVSNEVIQGHKEVSRSHGRLSTVRVTYKLVNDILHSSVKLRWSLIFLNHVDVFRDNRLLLPVSKYSLLPNLLLQHNSKRTHAHTHTHKLPYQSLLYQLAHCCVVTANSAATSTALLGEIFVTVAAKVYHRPDVIPDAESSVKALKADTCYDPHSPRPANCQLIFKPNVNNTTGLDFATF